MYDIYHKYILLLTIKKLKCYKLKLQNKWSLWHHGLFNNDWTIESYKKLYTFDNIANFGYYIIILYHYIMVCFF